MIESSRRQVVVGAAATAAIFGLPAPLAVFGSARAAELEAKGFHRFKIGDVEITTVSDGQWNRPHDPGFITNASVDETKSALAASGLPTDGVTIPFTVTFARAGGRTIMFDAGTGAQLAPTAGKLAANMAAAGIAPEAIDTILLTHFHPDHVFGLMTKETNAPVYPNARIVAPDAEMAFWTDPGVFAKLPEHRHGLAKRIQATLGTWKNIERVSGETEVVPGIRTLPAHGHTPGHTVYHIASGTDQLLVLADTSNIPALFVRNPGWHAVFDSDPQAAEAVRRTLFDRVVADSTIVTGYHYGMPGAGRIAKDGAAYAFVPLA
ncbi:MAG: MBL fold metallo-hydrolase [Hyphomicrobiaceae bacterium]|nr:MBL fold metallo-hydrolase [Hyphomicrobiaceae bacterium]